MAAPVVIVAVLTDDEWTVLDRPVNGRAGGHQYLLRRILQRANRELRRVTLLPQDLEKVERYAAKYGDGGYQDRFWAVLSAVRRALGRP